MAFICGSSTSGCFDQAVTACSKEAPTGVSTCSVMSRNEEVITDGCKHIFPFRIMKSYQKVMNDNRGKELKMHHGTNDIYKTNKHLILKNIDRVDLEILKTEKKLEMLMKSRKEYRKNKPKVRKLETIKSLSERIYSENKARTETLSKKLQDFAGTIVDLSGLKITEIDVLKENAINFKTFRPHLVEYLKNKKSKETVLEARVIKEEIRQRKDWDVLLNKLERCKKRNKQLMERVELFEEVYPELKTERENQELLRSETVRTRNHVKDYSGYLLGKQTSSETSRIKAAKIPRLLLPHERKCFISHNNRLESMVAPPCTYWSTDERILFKERYLDHPKNFPVIASFFKDKTIPDCIAFYYLTKKSENYKELLCLRDGRRTGRNTRRYLQGK